LIAVEIIRNQIFFLQHKMLSDAQHIRMLSDSILYYSIPMSKNIKASPSLIVSIKVYLHKKPRQIYENALVAQHHAIWLLSLLAFD
jgi:hypothetical protein